jgi:hypothetical protein
MREIEQEERSKGKSQAFDSSEEESESFAQRKHSPPKPIVKKASFTELIALQSSAGFWQPSSLATL